VTEVIEFKDAAGNPLKGLALMNAQRKAAKLAKQAAQEAPAKAEEPAQEAPAQEVTASRPVLDTAPEPAPEPELPLEDDLYSDLLGAVQAFDSKFQLQHSKETGEQYLVRLLKVAVEPTFPEELWNGLMPATQEWVGAAFAVWTKADGAGTKFPVDLPGFKDKFGSSTKEPKAKKEKVAKEPKTVKAKKEKPAKAARPEGFVKRIKRWVVQNPAGTLKELTAHVAGWEPVDGKLPASATLSVIYSSAREVLDLVREAGHWKD
jgi:hypothetical protein